MKKYIETHVSVHDGSPAMMLTQDEIHIALMNEDGYTWIDRQADWRPIDTKDSTMTTNIARRAAAIEVALANKAQGRDRGQTLETLANLLADDYSLAREATLVAYGDTSLDVDDILDDIADAALDHVGQDIGGPYLASGYRDRVRAILADVFAAGALEGHAATEYDFEPGDTYLGDYVNPFHRKD
jgi:hypothetical protein